MLYYNSIFILFSRKHNVPIDQSKTRKKKSITNVNRRINRHEIIIHYRIGNKLSKFISVKKGVEPK